MYFSITISSVDNGSSFHSSFIVTLQINWVFRSSLGEYVHHPWTHSRTYSSHVEHGNLQHITHNVCPTGGCWTAMSVTFFTCHSTNDCSSSYQSSDEDTVLMCSQLHSIRKRTFWSVKNSTFWVVIVLLNISPNGCKINSFSKKLVYCSVEGYLVANLSIMCLVNIVLLLRSHASLQQYISFF